MSSDTPAIRMNWTNLLFVHWRVDPAVLRPLIPAALELDVFDNAAWIGLVPFRMEDTSLRGVPRLPGTANFYECNVRTYVRYRGRAGVWFFSLDAQSLLPVVGARLRWSLNYVHSRFQVMHTGDAIDYQLVRRRGPWPRAHARITWRAHEPLPPSHPGSLEHFLTERYWLFAHRRGRIMGGEVQHTPWPLRRAELLHLDESLIRASGISIDSSPSANPPLVYASDRLETIGYALQKL